MVRSVPYLHVAGGTVLQNHPVEIKERALGHQMLKAIGEFLSNDFVSIERKKNLITFMLQFVDQGTEINNKLSTHIWFLY
jgi:hypothetical protein